jgi:hypothetical protein
VDVDVVAFVVRHEPSTFDRKKILLIQPISNRDRLADWQIAEDEAISRRKDRLALCASLGDQLHGLARRLGKSDNPSNQVRGRSLWRIDRPRECQLGEAKGPAGRIVNLHHPGGDRIRPELAESIEHSSRQGCQNFSIVLPGTHNGGSGIRDRRRQIRGDQWGQLRFGIG